MGIQGFYLDPHKDSGFGLADAKHGGGVDVLFGHQGENRFGYELHGSAETIETGKQLRTDFYNYALGADLFYAFGDRTHLTPFILVGGGGTYNDIRSEEHTSELQSLMRISYAVFCLKKNTQCKHHDYLL